MRVAVVTFPGSNCDRDCHYVLGPLLGYSVLPVFHKETKLPDCDLVVIPGGFSYGDYLRCGALAKLSNIMPAVRAFAERGGFVIGICNGFQILCEAGLLPGALVRNDHLRFVSRLIEMRVENNQTAFTSAYERGATVRMPIAHGEGCYVADPATVAELEREHRILLRYVGPVRADIPDGNPNGSTHAIAGIVNRAGNVFGLMPHPERASDPAVTVTDGAGIFHSIAAAIRAQAKSHQAASQDRVPA